MKISIEYRAKFKKIIQYVVVRCGDIWLIWYENLCLSEMFFTSKRNCHNRTNLYIIPISNIDFLGAEEYNYRKLLKGRWTK